MLRISEEIKNATQQGLPVVALESTIISHGMPFPRNYETALECESIIRKQGAIPATIAIINGDIVVGLTSEEIKFIAEDVKNVRKVSKRDIPLCVAMGLSGATTVSATMYIAHLAKIDVFATGGIGGVHREYNETLDVSADLEELSITPVNVVCAGIKAILDLPRTLEYLETKGVLVVGYNTDYLPAFYTSRSKLLVDANLKTPQEIALTIKAKRDLFLPGGILITNPIDEKNSLNENFINKIIDEALKKCYELNITGNKITPFLLKWITDKTEGVSLDANIALVYQNCYLAAEISKELKKL